MTESYFWKISLEAMCRIYGVEVIYGAHVIN